MESALLKKESMRHNAKIDWWIIVAVLVGVLVPLASHTYWASGMVLGILLMGAYPQSYKTTPRGLLVHVDDAPVDLTPMRT